MSIMGALSLGIGVGITSGGRRRFDPDAAAYIAAVEGPSGDNQALERAVRVAIDTFVRGCKSDGIWDAIKACCIMAGARTLAGALTPLKGPAPTNFNFVSADYNRITGLKGDGATKYLDTGWTLGDFPGQGSAHVAVHVSQAVPSTGARYAGSRADVNSPWQIFVNGSAASDSLRFWLGGGSGNEAVIGSAAQSVGLIGASRSDTVLSARAGALTGARTEAASGVRGAQKIGVFALISEAGAVSGRNASRMQLYSLGGTVDLALLRNRTDALMAAIDGAIP
jgi:hypothetical protein